MAATQAVRIETSELVKTAEAMRGLISSTVAQRKLGNQVEVNELLTQLNRLNNSFAYLATL